MCNLKSRLDGKVAVVTGGSSGIGYEAAKELAKYGAKVVIASRNETKLRTAKENIINSTGNKDVMYKILDLGSLESVRQFASELYLEDKIDVLINNAGAVGLPDRLTLDGLNLTMQVNYFGVFLLTYLLVPMLKMSSPSRVIIGTATSMYLGEINFDYWRNTTGRYNLVTSLGSSKLADALFMVELHERVWDSGININGFDPFLVRDTDIFGNLDNFTSVVSQFLVNMIGREKTNVGAELAYLAASPDVEDVSGKYFKFCTVWYNHWLVNDKELRRNIWDKTKEIVKITAVEEWD
ncbi:retinol dehydrogenase 13-like [Plodia interpunctella]|uniref:retinol dehydrogenase 13-like n=1 Tax=Plodia interpunctella TaxID=58824 RepID=UPI0023683A9D|nr:retinol dehydrogenase 13-like [Plodia interpunctella]